MKQSKTTGDKVTGTVSGTTEDEAATKFILSFLKSWSHINSFKAFLYTVVKPTAFLKSWSHVNTSKVNIYTVVKPTAFSHGKEKIIREIKRCLLATNTSKTNAWLPLMRKIT